MAKNIVIIILVILLAGSGYYAWDSMRKAEDSEKQTLNLREAVATAESEKENLQNSLREAETKLENARASLEERIISLQGDLASRDELIENLRDKIEPLEERLEEYRDRIASAISDRESLEERVRTLTESLQLRDTEIAELRSSLESAQNSFQEARRNLTRLRQEQQLEPEPDAEDVATEEDVRVAMPVVPEAQSAGIFTSQKRVTLRNTSDRELTLSASYAREADGTFATTEVTVPANASIRLEGDRNRNFLPRDRITLNHPDYLPLEYRVP